MARLSDKMLRVNAKLRYDEKIRNINSERNKISGILKRSKKPETIKKYQKKLAKLDKKEQNAKKAYENDIARINIKSLSRKKVLAKKQLESFPKSYREGVLSQLDALIDEQRQIIAINSARDTHIAKITEFMQWMVSNFYPTDEFDNSIILKLVLNTDNLPDLTNILIEKAIKMADEMDDRTDSQIYNILLYDDKYFKELVN